MFCCVLSLREREGGGRGKREGREGEEGGRREAEGRAGRAGRAGKRRKGRGRKRVCTRFSIFTAVIN